MKKFTLITSLFYLSLSWANFGSLMTPSIRVNIGTEQELKDTLADICDANTAVSLFDQVGRGKVEIRFLNDYNFEDPNTDDLSKVNDDIGKTHGFKMSVTKNIAPTKGDKYYVTISYSTDLYTNSNKPEDFQRDYRDVVYKKDGKYFADVYYKEENLLNLLIGKVESKDAFYWKAGVGYHELNTEDTSRGVMFSALAQQNYYHRTVNNDIAQIYREYNYLHQDASQRGLMVEGHAGMDKTLFESSQNRTFARAGLRSRLTAVEDASFIGGYLHLGHDLVPYSDYIPAVRLKAGIEVQQYSDSSNYREAFIELSTGGRPFQTKIKYVVPLTDDPEYLNALAEDFPKRDETHLPKEPIIWIGIEGRLPN
ncbi:MAG: hypothetical protein KC478_04815 [Bacteriovoracaceae bacterium]|nr:hypothetical protein [Bacteriovoracaceae bacterium]